MLVLTRAINQTIMIGDDVEITIVDVKGDKVRVGIRAPQAIPVHRKEVYLAIRQANIEAAQAAPDTPDRLDEIEKMMKKKENPPA
jgi:carbon storage regulator